MLLFTLILNKLIYFTGKEESFTLTAGQYTVHCYGAQGGTSYKGGKKTDVGGGYGAHVYGTMKIYGTGTLFYANVGGEGQSGPKERNPGGFNGGGTSGKDTGTTSVTGKEDGSGGGGGSTDLRIYDNEISSRVIVAAGGAGSVYGYHGNDGGDENGRWMTTSKKIEPSKDTTQTKGNALLYGGNGGDHSSVPGSGGGGGYWGGKGRGGAPKLSEQYAASDGGSSYISGYKSCVIHEKLNFTDGNMIVGDSQNTGNGHIEIIYDYVCSENCYDCSRDQTCDRCAEGFYLYENKCYTSCPRGSIPKANVFECEACQANCDSCSGSTTHCDSCKDGFSLYNNECLETCPKGTVSVNKVCEKCTEPCSSCSLSVTQCESCVEGFFLYQNKCYNECGTLDNKEEGSYFGKDDTEKVCRKCSDKNCINCADDFAKCKACHDSYLLDEATNVCLPKPTNTPMASPSKSPMASPSKSPVATPEQTPIATPAPETSSPEELPDKIIVYQPDCTDSGRYEKVINYTKKVSIEIKVSNFTGINHERKGGAIHIINSGLQCEEVKFKECMSFEGAGGAIHVKNTFDFPNTITLDHLEFHNCEAQYGGAVYIYSNSVNNKVVITHCTFNGNTAKAKETESKMFGGAAIFLSAVRGKMVRNKFSNNNGPGGSVKLYNVFNINSYEDDVNSEAKSLSSDKQSILISECSFEVNKKSGCGLFYLPGKSGSSFELNGCKFTGELHGNSHYIDGKAVQSGQQKLVVKNCKFSYDAKQSLNLDPNNNFLQIDLKDQEFEFEERKSIKKKSSSSTLKVIVVFGAPAAIAFIIVAMFVVFTIKKNKHNILQENLMSTEVLDLF